MILKLGKGTCAFHLQNYPEKEGRWVPRPRTWVEPPSLLSCRPPPSEPVARSHPRGLPRRTANGVSGKNSRTCFLLGLRPRKSQGGDWQIKQISLQRRLFTGSILASALQGTWGTKDWARDKTPLSGRQATAGISCRCCCQVPAALRGLAGQASGKSRDSPHPLPLCLSASLTQKWACVSKESVFSLLWEPACANPHTHARSLTDTHACKYEKQEVS